MQIDIHNVAAMKHASIEIDGITVLAGKNDTGKSTVSKALWSVFDSLYRYEEQLSSYRQESIRSAVSSAASMEARRRIPLGRFVSLLARNVVEKIDDIRLSPHKLDNLIDSTFDEACGTAYPNRSLPDLINLDQLRADITQIISYDDQRLLCGVAENNFMSEFARQPQNVDERDLEASVDLIIAGHRIGVSLFDGNVTSIASPMRLDVRAIYIDDSFILDESLYPQFGHGLYDEDRHQRLRRLLNDTKKRENLLDELIASERLADVMRQMERALPGQLLRGKRRELSYLPPEYENPIDSRNMSAGMKTFGLLKLLIENGSIERKSVVILDEPEVHLHPDWQLVLAELIVLLQQAFDLHVLMATHSPYFLRAIQIYAAKHSMATRCCYYATERKGKWCEAKDVTHRTDLIFNELALPFEKLEQEWSRLS